MRKIIGVIIAATLLVACNNFGKKVSKDYLEVYYKGGITKEQAQRTLDYIYPLWKEDSGKTPEKSIQLSKGAGDTINMGVVTDKDKLKEIGDDTFIAMANLFSDSIYNGAPVNIIFSNETFKGFRTLAFQKTKQINYGEKVSSGNIEVYNKSDLSKEQAGVLAAYLEKIITPETTISFQSNRNEQGIFILNMLSTPEKAKDIKDSDLQTIAEGISHNVLNDAPLNFQFTDDSFTPFRIYEYRPGPPPPVSTPEQ
jgi:hypothetical protein